MDDSHPRVRKLIIQVQSKDTTPNTNIHSSSPLSPPRPSLQTSPSPFFFQPCPFSPPCPSLQTHASLLSFQPRPLHSSPCPLFPPLPTHLRAWMPSGWRRGWAGMSERASEKKQREISPGFCSLHSLRNRTTKSPNGWIGRKRLTRQTQACMHHTHEWNRYTQIHTCSTYVHAHTHHICTYTYTCIHMHVHTTTVMHTHVYVLGKK